MNEYGFTGTQRGMLDLQKSKFSALLAELFVDKLHLGDCIGADFQAHHIARAEHPKIRLYGHPPIDSKKRAFCQYDHLFPERTYMVRNLLIVEFGQSGLLATPSRKEVQRSGTWSTIRKAQRYKRKIYIIYPDGSLEER